MSGIQARLVAGVAAIVVAVILTSGYLAERGLRARETALLSQSLQQRASLVAELVGDVPIRLGSRERLQGLALRAAAAADARVTLVAADGRVVADSGVPIEELDDLENHAARAEVGAALAGVAGSETRRSRTLQRPFLYLGLPAPAGEGAVRLAVDLADVNARIASLRRELLLPAALGLTLAVLLAWGLSRWTLRPLRELGRVVGSIARGEFDQRFSWPSRDEMGRIAEDVNEMGDQLRRRLREVTADKEQLQAVLAGMVEGVLVVDRAGRVVLANPRLRELSGAWGDVVGRPHWEVIRRPEVEEALRRATGSGEPVMLELMLGDRDGQVLEMHAVRFPSRGELRGIVAVFHDVTELRRLEGIRREFVANVSHELKTPLTAIRGFAETLLGEGISEEQRAQYLDVILRHSERLGALIEDVLSLSRVESRKLQLEPDAVDVGRLAATLLRDMKPQLDARKLTAELVESGSGVAWADRRAVEQVLSNLLINAAKYTEPGGRIEVHVGGLAEQLRVEVRDTGMGIPAADLPRIFERFYRVDKARSRDLGGTGLGLAIVKHLVQSLGGEVWVQSEVGEGSTFTFTLPRSA
jgi:two-component system phosphate regulon sensor histidine kinase PhoR